MRLDELLPLYLGGASEIIDLSHEDVDASHYLRMPDSVRYGKYRLAEAETLDLGPTSLILSLLGPNPPAQTNPDALAPVLRRLQPGARAILLIGWPIHDLPCHRLLGPLVGGSCQVIEAVSLDRTASPGTHGALLIERVDKLAPPRSYLADIPTQTTPYARPASDPADELRTMLQIVNEHVLGDLVARSLRRRLIELELVEAERLAAITRARELENVEAERAAAITRANELEDAEIERAAAITRIAELERLVTERDAQLRLSQRQIATLRSSASLQIGRAIVHGIRHPARAVVTVPRDLVGVWRLRRARMAPTPHAKSLGPPTDCVVPIALPGEPGKENFELLTMTAPSDLLVPRRLAQGGLAGYEKESLACFLAASDVAGLGCVLDIGSNVGIYAAVASALTRRDVVAFEPTPSLVDVARRFATDNNLDYRTESLALGAKNGVAMLYLSDSSDSSNSLAAGFRKSSVQIEVPVETLDSYVARTGYVPAVMKIDTETTEPEVLIGAALTITEHRPWILCEVLFGRVEERLTKVLAPFEYHWYHITGQIPYQEADQIVGDRTHRNMMWLFAPQRPGEDFLAAVRGHLNALARCTVEQGVQLQIQRRQ